MAASGCKAPANSTTCSCSPNPHGSKWNPPAQKNNAFSAAHNQGRLVEKTSLEQATVIPSESRDLSSPSLPLLRQRIRLQQHPQPHLTLRGSVCAHSDNNFNGPRIP